MMACSASETPGGTAGSSGSGNAGNVAGAGGTTTSVAGGSGGLDEPAGAGGGSTGGASGGVPDLDAGTVGQGGNGGSSDSGSQAEASAPVDAGTDAASRGNKVLIYSKTTGFRHDSIPVAAAAITKAAAKFDLVAEQSEDPAKFATGQLDKYAAVIMLATTGEPFGTPGTTQTQTLVDFVEGGGALVGIEDCTHAYETEPYVSLLGGEFSGHIDFGPSTCATVGNHPTVMKFPATFAVTDEIYAFTRLNPKNQVVLQCGTDKRPISWVRNEGKGRVFYTALGHSNEIWTTFPLVDDHVLPGLLWALGRTP
jgi:type 1 glutamine amidotransferase